MANRWTEEQQKAIDIEGNNVIVSAGAGSGKTAVLSERVLRKVKSGTHINELLILTFTKAAAQEMKDRIRKKLISNNLDKEVSLIDGAYITTFDSYSLAVVKKYHYVLGISRDIGISDAVLLEITKRDILDSIMEKHYKMQESKFKDFVCKFSVKDDKDLVDIIIKLSNKLDLKYDRVDFLKNYMYNYYSDDAINNSVLEYTQMVFNDFNSLKEEIINLESFLEEKKLNTLIDASNSLINSETYEDIYENINKFILPRSNGYSDDAKEVNEKIKALRDEVKKNCIYTSTKEMKDEILETYDDTNILVNLLLELEEKFSLVKREKSLYDFNDISHLAIKLVSEHEDVREEIKRSFKEILIDEYQDTSDNQEDFISLISNNNVYMVGDIKQSIYRFRNANPYIFKNKYDTYNKDNSKGYKIDLNKNFRSREEVLNNINMLFDGIMDDDIGGANYKVGHKAIFGNATYNIEGKTNQVYDLTIKTYSKDKDISDVEKEAFIIASDIKNKVENKYQIFEKDDKYLRDVTYNDFVILMDKKKNFDLYKKIFEYLGVPLTVYREEKINNTDDFLVIHNLLKLVLLVANNDYGVEFRYTFMSIARSFLFSYNDSEIFSIFKDKSFKNNEIVKKALELKDEVNLLPARTFFRKMLEVYNYNEKILLTTEIIKKEKCIEYLDNLIGTLKDSGSTILDIMYYLDKVLEKDYDIKYDNSVEANCSVKIMSIHKSKGLEFSICYFADLQNKFNIREQKEKVVFSNNYGILLPSINEETKATIRIKLYRNLESREEISERIRLFYVALTRCKEHMILVCPLVEEDKSRECGLVPNFIRKKYSSFYSILKSIWYKLDKYVIKEDSINYSKDYLRKIKNSEIDFANYEAIKVQEFNNFKEEEKEEHFSKTTFNIQTLEEAELLKFGTKAHQILEEIDFKNLRFDLFEISEFMKNKIQSFLNSEIIQNNLNSKFYKEYEFITEKDNKKLHGIIDLMIENKDTIIIIDYKLKNIDDIHYISQLNGYREYIKSISNKNIDVYLYSIMDEQFKSLDN